MRSCRLAIVIGLISSLGCTSSHRLMHPSPSPGIAFRDSFTELAATQAHWVAVIPMAVGASAQIEDSQLRLAMPPNGNGDVVFRHRLDVSELRGKRVRVRARAKGDADGASSAWATFEVQPSNRAPSYSDYASSRAVRSSEWTDIRAVLDVDPQAATAEISLVLHGPGQAWFDDIEVQAIGSLPVDTTHQLSQQQLYNVAALARAATLIRYIHPSDQSADLDWNVFLPTAIDRVLHISDTEALLRELGSLFAPIAPTASFMSTTTQAPGAPLSQGSGKHLSRWWHHGLGPSDPYASYREGRARDSDVYIETGFTAHILKPADCKQLTVRAETQRVLSGGEAWIFVELLRPGRERTDVEEPITVGAKQTSLAMAVSQDTQQIRLGLRLLGRAGVRLESLSLKCEGGAVANVNIEAETWTTKGWGHLYAWSLEKCSNRECATLLRKPYESVFVPERDILETDIGRGIRMRLPRAVWTDNTGTLPIPHIQPLLEDFAIRDLPTRLATVVGAWGTLSLFYPYFDDQRIDWQAALLPALAEAAASNSPGATHAALTHLLVKLRDNHVRVSHPAIDTTGLLPIAFRCFGTKIVAIGGLPEYTKMIPPGAELLELDGVPALEVYQLIEQGVSAATDGWRAYLSASRLGIGPVGTSRRVRVRLDDGSIVERLLPFFPRELYVPLVHDPRPQTGTEVSPGIVYLDFDTLSADAWNTLLPRLKLARSVIFDFRGYLSSGAFASLAHLTEHTLFSPKMEIPLLGLPGLRRPPTQWSIRPASPRLSAQVIVLIDGQSMSAVETFLQIFHDNRLGYIVGEPSGGTNGNMNTFSVPGGFSVRFTGMRMIAADGIVTQGRGIQPDQVVHPTLESVRAGRDEILEAGIAAAQRLAPR